MHQNLLFFFLGFAAAVHAAPTSLDAATLLQNGQEAQIQNAAFRNLKASDPCQDGQVACIGKSIAKCQGTNWETRLGRCSRSQFCFALPSVSSNGINLACTSEKSALNLISATGATGGIFGNPSNSTSKASGIDNGGTVQRGSNTPSASYIMSPSTLVSDFTPVATSVGPHSTPAISAPDVHASRPYAMDQPTVTSSLPSQTAIPDTVPSLSVSPAPAPQISSYATASGSTSTTPRQRFTTLIVTLLPSQIMTLPSVTRTISPEDASSIVSRINAIAKSTVTASPPASYMPPLPTSNPVLSETGSANPPASASSPVTTTQAQGNYGGYGGY